MPPHCWTAWTLYNSVNDLYFLCCDCTPWADPPIDVLVEGGGGDHMTGDMVNKRRCPLCHGIAILASPYWYKY